VKNTIKEFYENDAQKSNAYCQIVNENHTERIKAMIEEDHGGVLECGGGVKISERYIEPTVVSNPKLTSKMMTEEIFGPILPIISYNNIQ